MKIIPLTLHHAWWIPMTILYYVLYSYLSKLSNNHAHIEPWYASKYLWFAYIFGALCPFWIMVTRISKNLLFDGMLYDNIMFLTYITTLVVLNAGDKFALHHWIGLGLVISGSVLMRISF